MSLRSLLTVPIMGLAAIAPLHSQTTGRLVEQNLPGDSARGRSGVLWRDPGDVSSRDMAAGPLGRAGAPRPPFAFQEEAGGGTSAKIIVRDDDKRTWEMKWGEETKAETFATRLLWAVGYMVEPSYFVQSGKIQNVGALGRAAPQIDREAGNAFFNARFELRDDKSLMVPGKGWLFDDNPFKGTNELQGLKIMSILLANWDLKDPKTPGGSNTAIIRVRDDAGREEMHYIVNDWGATMGKWGGIATRSKWDCKGYAGQNKDFVEGAGNGEVKFGYDGKRPEFAEGITVENVRWLIRYLGQITDDQLRAALIASGASGDETQCFVPAVRERIEALRSLNGGGHSE